MLPVLPTGRGERVYIPGVKYASPNEFVEENQRRHIFVENLMASSKYNRAFYRRAVIPTPGTILNIVCYPPAPDPQHGKCHVRIFLLSSNSSYYTNNKSVRSEHLEKTIDAQEALVQVCQDELISLLLSID